MYQHGGKETSPAGAAGTVPERGVLAVAERTQQLQGVTRTNAAFLRPWVILRRAGTKLFVHFVTFPRNESPARACISNACRGAVWALKRSDHYRKNAADP